MIVRPTDVQDVEALAHFARWTYARAFGDSMAVDDLAHHLAHRLSDAYFAAALHGDTILLARETDLIGFAQIGPARVEGARPGDEQLRRLYVHPDRQRRGVGTRLLEDTLAHPRLKRARVLYLDVWDQNHGARRLYERFGFAVVGTVPLVTPSGAVTGRDLLMRRPLP